MFYSKRAKRRASTIHSPRSFEKFKVLSDAVSSIRFKILRTRFFLRSFQSGPTSSTRAEPLNSQTRANLRNATEMRAKFCESETKPEVSCRISSSKQRIWRKIGRTQWNTFRKCTLLRPQDCEMNSLPRSARLTAETQSLSQPLQRRCRLESAEEVSRQLHGVTICTEWSPVKRVLPSWTRNRLRYLQMQDQALRSLETRRLQRFLCLRREDYSLEGALEGRAEVVFTTLHREISQGLLRH
mmetsp:Transcript_595/g.1149  ORF Transcript_595/g.1149 Transcript_595/m.1149 type:complete len:241 (-) Transcript_595:741-1463(-)